MITGTMNDDDVPQQSQEQIINIDALNTHSICTYHFRSSIILQYVERHPEALAQVNWGRLPIYSLLENISSSTDLALMMIEKYPALEYHDDGYLPLHLECLYQYRAIIILKCIELYPEGLDNRCILLTMKKIDDNNFPRYKFVLSIIFTHCPSGVYDRNNYRYLFRDIRENPLYRRRILHMLLCHVFTPTHESDHRDLNWQSRETMVMLLLQMKMKRLCLLK
jgi:hypothetical protein